MTRLLRLKTMRYVLRPIIIMVYMRVVVENMLLIDHSDFV